MSLKDTQYKTDILLTTWNRPEFTYRVIRSIRLNTLTPHRLTVIDNGSERKTTNLLDKLRSDGMIDVLLLLGTNRGTEFSRQLGLSLVRSDRFVSTDNDCLPHKPWERDYDTDMLGGVPVDWLTQLNSLMDKNSDYAAIACRTQVMIGSGDIFGENPPDIVDFTCGGSLRLMNTEVVRKLGGWDRSQDLRGNEEHYICGKIRDAGFKCGFASYVPCYHLFGESNWGYDPDLPPEATGHREVSRLPQDDKGELKDYEH